jgi:hypothetical protein
MFSARDAAFMLNPVENISGSTTTCVRPAREDRAASKVARLAALSSQWRGVWTREIVRDMMQVREGGN